jgi:hypothetical protein
VVLGNEPTMKIGRPASANFRRAAEAAWLILDCPCRIIALYPGPCGASTLPCTSVAAAARFPGPRYSYVNPKSEVSIQETLTSPIRLATNQNLPAAVKLSSLYEFRDDQGCFHM